MAGRAARWLPLIGIVALAFNLRPAAVSVGPVLADVTAGLRLTPVAAGMLTSLPVVAFAGFGALAPRLAARLGLHRACFAALVAVVVGLGVRAVVDSAPVFMTASLLALGGMAAANVLLPSLVKWHFPDRIGLVASIYTTSLAIGLTLASMLTVPVAQAGGSWRWGLGVWAVVAAIAVLPWLGLLGHDQRLTRAPARIRLGDVARTRLGWAMAIFFGLQSIQAYAIFGWFAQLFRDAGFSATTAGLLLGVITGTSIPVSFLVPRLASRLPNPAPVLFAHLACFLLGYLGLLVAPVSGAWLWALLIGLGTGVFPVVLTLIGLRARTSEGTAALSGFTQSVGYLIAAGGPFAIGLIYEHTGGWTAPLWVMIGLLAPLAVAAVAISAPRYLEDQPGVQARG